MKFCIIDLDGTLCDDTHRFEHALKRDWDTYHSTIKEDKCFVEVKHLLHMLIGTVKIVILTSRPRRYKIDTENWLHAHEIPYDYLLMRNDNDLRDSRDVKIYQLEKFFGDKENVLKSVMFALEDRAKIVKRFREYGIPCWQVRDCRSEVK